MPKSRKRQTRRFRRNKRANRAIPPVYRQTTQTLGSGTTVNYFEADYNTNVANTIVQLSSVLNQSEFRTKALSWTYMKVVGVTISLYPDAKVTTTKWLMLWTNDDDSGNNVDFSDSTKVMTTHTLRIQHRRWRCPNAVLPTGLNLQGHPAVNLRDWIVIDDIGTYNSSTNEVDYSLPGRLKLSKSNTEFTRFRVTLKIIFRNAKYPSVPGIVSMLRDRLDNEGKSMLDALRPHLKPADKKFEAIQPIKELIELDTRVNLDEAKPPDDED